MVALRSMVACLCTLTVGLPLTAGAQPSSAPEFIPLATPCRALDTRVTGTPVPADVPTTIQISGVTPGPGGDCGVPATAVGAALNFTITQPQGPGHLRVWSSGGLPLASLVSFVAGEDVANAVDIALGAGGTVLVQPVATTHLVVDIYGYFTGGELAGSNTALGDSALSSNTTGFDNTALGANALDSNTTGSFNIAIGLHAGNAVMAGSRNIHIGNGGGATDDHLIRIGEMGIHTSTFIGGIFGAMVSGAAVVVNSNGQLGGVFSSRRVKEDIRDMAEASEGLAKLRPVAFRYKAELANGPRLLEYGLIAEEVAEIYPELVVRDTDGQPAGVKYHVLPAMLLNEFQRQQRQLESQTARLEAQQRELEELRAQVRALIGRRASSRE